MAVNLSSSFQDAAEEEDIPPIITESQVSFALLILVILLMTTLFISYQFQKRRIRILHETVVGIFLGTIFFLILFVPFIHADKIWMT